MTKSQNVIDAIDTQENPVQIPLEKGKWKTLPNNPTRSDGLLHEYCPPMDVQEVMDRLPVLPGIFIGTGLD